MHDPEDASDDAELISRLFALLTSKFEDAATIAVDGQGTLPPEQLRDFAVKLESLVSEAAILSAAIRAMLRRT